MNAKKIKVDCHPEPTRGDHVRFPFLPALAAAHDYAARIALDPAPVIAQDLLPICSYCKKTRNAEGRWEHLAAYLVNDVRLKLTHGICPECMKLVEKEIRAFNDNLPERRTDMILAADGIAT